MIADDRIAVAEVATLFDALAATAASVGDSRGVQFYDKPGASAFRSYAELDRNARTIGSALQAEGIRGGQAVVLAMEPGLPWCDAAYGVLYAGAAFVPVAASGADLAGRIAGIAAASDASAVLVDESVIALLGDQLDHLGVGVVRVEHLIATGDPARWERPETSRESAATLLFTSGSTGEPKGVIVTHGGMLATAQIGEASNTFHREAIVVGWAPLHHAMGLGLQLILPATLGARTIMTSTAQFQRRPVFWLQLMSSHRATVSLAGNFAFGLCTKLATDEQIAEIDLSSVKVLISGSEPVRPDTVHAFIDRFASAGLDPSVIAPTLGMTEAMLVAMKPTNESLVTRSVDADLFGAGELVPAAGDRALEVVSCGRALPMVAVEIVDPLTLRPVQEGTIGELWVSSPAVSPGYFRRPDATADTFGHHLPDDPRTYMRSGDLAAVLDGELYITGRLKEVIILRGRNVYPQDIEAAAAGVSPALGVGVAYELDGKRIGVGVVIEVDEELLAEGGESPASLMSRIREAVTTRFSVPTVDIVLAPTGAIERTATGKVRRNPTRALLANGTLPILHSSAVGSATV